MIQIDYPRKRGSAQPTARFLTPWFVILGASVFVSGCGGDDPQSSLEPILQRVRTQHGVRRDGKVKKLDVTHRISSGESTSGKTQAVIFVNQDYGNGDYRKVRYHFVLADSGWIYEGQSHYEMIKSGKQDELDIGLNDHWLNRYKLRTSESHLLIYRGDSTETDQSSGDSHDHASP